MRLSRLVPWVLCVALACGGSTRSGGSGDLPGLVATDDVAADGVAADVPSSDGTPDAVADAPGGGDDPGEGEPTLLDLAPGADIQGGCAECAYGSVRGLTCAPNQTTAVPNVKVYVDSLDCAGNPLHLETYSNAKGEYQLDNVPCGQQTVQIQKSSFTHQFAVFVDAGLVADASGAERCFKANVAKIAVITGDWDRIEDTLDLLKLKYDVYNGAGGGWDSPSSDAAEAVDFLTDGSKLNTYDVLFIDCGSTPANVMNDYGSQISPNLKAFVKKGGSIYASDYGFPYFADTWPGAVKFPSDPYVVDGNQTLLGHVIDPPLFAYLGKDNVSIDFGLGPLTEVTGVDPDTMVHIEGYFKQFGATLPIMMSFVPTPGGGRVVYTTFHNDEQGAIKKDLSAILNYVVFLL